MKEKLSGCFRQPAVRAAITTLVVLVVVSGLLWLIWLGYYYDWTGFGWYTNAKGEAERAKTLWDWLQLLIVPIVLAVGGLLFNRAERRAEREIAEKRTQQEREIADNRAQQERDLANQRSQEAALQTYFDKMTELLLHHNLRKSRPESEARDVARARTLTVLRVLDGERKGILVRFLHEAGLIAKDRTVVWLTGADLVHASLIEANLAKANLIKADLIGANLSQADLSQADLSQADLSQADLGGADLNSADLSYADLIGANLCQASLCQANLSGAVLSEADLSQADLGGANLSRAMLNRANLTEATVSSTQLTQARSLEGATMPDGTKLE